MLAHGLALQQEMKLPRSIKVIEKRLGRERAAGIVYPDSIDTIHIDPLLKAHDSLEILLHESMHLLLPDCPEMKVRAYSMRLQKLLWKDGWRRIQH